MTEAKEAYFLNAESTIEIVRLIEQDRTLTKAKGLFLKHEKKEIIVFPFSQTSRKGAMLKEPGRKYKDG
jgi:hypothetical protein